jgi:hypothetical protein
MADKHELAQTFKPDPCGSWQDGAANDPCPSMGNHAAKQTHCIVVLLLLSLLHLAHAAIHA